MYATLHIVLSIIIILHTVYLRDHIPHLWTDDMWEDEEEDEEAANTETRR